MVNADQSGAAYGDRHGSHTHYDLCANTWHALAYLHTTGLPELDQQWRLRGGWRLDFGTHRADAVLHGRAQPHPQRGRSMAMGATLPTSPNVASYSSVQQTVTIPAGAQTAQLRFWYYPISNAAAGGLNRQEAILLNPWAFGETVAVLWRVTENNNAWVSKALDLTPYRGQTLSIYFNARNAGDGKRTSMFLDDVEVLACGGFTTFPETLPAELPPTVPGATAVPLPIYPTGPGFPSGETPGSGIAGVAPQPTVISVAPSTPAPVSVGPSPTPTLIWTDAPRSERKPLLGNFKLSLNPTTLAIMVGLIVLGTVLLIVYLTNRRDRDKGQNG